MKKMEREEEGTDYIEAQDKRAYACAGTERYSDWLQGRVSEGQEREAGSRMPWALQALLGVGTLS